MAARKKAATAAEGKPGAGRTGEIARKSALKLVEARGASSDDAAPRETATEEASAKRAPSKKATAKKALASRKAPPKKAPPKKAPASEKDPAKKAPPKKATASAEAPPTKVVAPTRFDGFPKAGHKFLVEIGKRQDREWFKEHKADYEAHCVDPLAALLREAAAKLTKAYPDLELLEPKVFRIQRDVRFSKDKSPYKDHVAGWLPVQRLDKPTMTPVALYVQLGAKEDMCGAGVYELEKEALDRFRQRVLEDEAGKELSAITRKLEKAGFTIDARSRLKNVPRGFDPEHPRAELLKLKGLITGFPPIPKDVRHNRKLLDWVVNHGKKAAPLVRWAAYNT